jgi:biopolymer transport protein ExbD
MNAFRVVFLFVGACVPLLAQEKSEQPRVVKLEAPSLPVSTQGKAAEGVDIVLAVVHAPAGGVKCDRRACASPLHWQAEVRLGANAEELPKAFAVGASEELRKHLEWAASPKARTKHASQVNVSDAKLSIRVPAMAPWPIVGDLLETAARAGIHDVGFVVVNAPAASELRLLVPLPTGAAVQVVDGAKAAPQDVRIALFVDRSTGTCVRMVDRSKIAEGEAGDAELRTKLKEAATKKVPAIIDAANGVEWQAVVSVIDACQAAGVEVHFTAWANPK